MTLETFLRFYSRCMGLRSWLKPLDQYQQEAWLMMLAEIPDIEEPFLIRELFRPHPGEEEKYKWVDVTLVLTVWEDLKRERNKALAAIRHKDRLLVSCVDDPAEVVNARLAERARLVAGLPEHVIVSAGVGAPPVGVRDVVERVPVAPPESVRRALGFVGRPV